MLKTAQVATDRAHDETKTVLPAEVARGVYMRNAPSLRALKLMHLMIAKAGGRMAEPVRHDMRLSDIRKIEGMAHHDQASLKPLFQELAAVVLTYDEPEQKRWTVGGLMEEAVADYRHEISGDVLVSWFFGRTFRKMADNSNHWAILDRQTVFHLGSKYSVLLFQHIASLVNLNHITSKTFTVPELRAVLGVVEGKIKRFADLNRDVIQPAITEINQLSRLNLTATPHKIGRTVASIEIAWEVKANPLETKRELDASKVGRKARRDETSETPALTFPATGGTAYAEPWDTIRKANCNWDQAKVADNFRQFLATKSIELDAKNIEALFTNFCAKLQSI